MSLGNVVKAGDAVGVGVMGSGDAKEDRGGVVLAFRGGVGGGVGGGDAGVAFESGDGDAGRELRLPTAVTRGGEMAFRVARARWAAEAAAFWAVVGSAIDSCLLSKVGGLIGGSSGKAARDSGRGRKSVFLYSVTRSSAVEVPLSFAKQGEKGFNRLASLVTGV